MTSGTYEEAELHQRRVAMKFVSEHAQPDLHADQLEEALDAAVEYFCYEGTDDEEESVRLFRMWHAFHGERVS